MSEQEQVEALAILQALKNVNRVLKIEGRRRPKGKKLFIIGYSLLGGQGGIKRQ